MDRSLGFGSTTDNLIALFRLGFPTAPHLTCLTSLPIITRRSVLQKVRRQTFNVLRLLVSAWFQVLFHSPPGVLFTFPSRYCSLSVAGKVFSLGKWSSQIPTRFLVPRSTYEITQAFILFVYKTFTSYGCSFQNIRLKIKCLDEVPQFPPVTRATPVKQRLRASAFYQFRLFPVRSPLLRESLLISFPRDT